jgi:hypothetical protein
MWLSSLMQLSLFSAIFLVWQVGGQQGSHIDGLEILGDPTANLPAVLAFGTAGHTALTTDGASISVIRPGGAGFILASDLAKLPSTKTTGEWSTAMNMGIGGMSQWALLDLDTFDEVGATSQGSSLADATAAAWSMNDRSFCTTPHDQFLGGHCRFGATQTVRTYHGLPPHSRLRIRARVHFIDRWQGESVILSADGQSVWSQSHSWCTGFLEQMCIKHGVDSCGKSTPDRLSVRAEATLNHNSPTLEIAFASSLPKGTDACQSSWGVDDVSLEVI